MSDLPTVVAELSAITSIITSLLAAVALVAAQSPASDAKVLVTERLSPSWA
jgi:hypothetical protein